RRPRELQQLSTAARDLHGTFHRWFGCRPHGLGLFRRVPQENGTAGVAEPPGHRAVSRGHPAVEPRHHWRVFAAHLRRDQASATLHRGIDAGQSHGVGRLGGRPLITTWSTGAADDNMDQAILVDLAGMVSRHPWWHARTKLTVALLHELGVEPPAT